MRILSAVATALVVVFVQCAIAAAQEVERPDAKTISIDEITPGMRGWGLTTVRGGTPERFEVTVLGVIRKISPERDAVILSASGLGLDHTGIFKGMSGSPVYLDGRLAGAVSFGWGWPKDAVCGITPIADMEKGLGNVRPPGRGAPSWEQFQIPQGRVADPFSQFLQTIGSPVGNSAVSSTPVTLAVSALSPQASALASALFPPESFQLAEGAIGAPDETAVAAALEPGSNIFVALVTGDMMIGAVGTVTDVRGKEVYAFGHPFLNLGRVALPMYAAETITVFASTLNSFKLTYPTKLVGAITHDFGTAIVGTLGAEPSTFPLEVTLHRGDDTKTLAYEIYRHWAISPQLAAVAAAESVTSLGEVDSDVTLTWRMEIEYEGQMRLEVSRAEAGRQAVSWMALGAGILLQRTMYNPIENLQPTAMTIEINIEAVNLSAEIESVTLRENEVAPGGKLLASVRIRPVLAEPVEMALEIDIPKNAPAGKMTLLFCDGPTSDVLDLKGAAHRMRPRTALELLDLLTPRRGAHELVTRIAPASLGLSRDGKEFPDLPPSALAVLAAPSVGSLRALYRTRAVSTHTPWVLSGKVSVPIMIKSAPEEKSR